MKYIGLYDNQLTGTIPDLSSLNLVNLYLYNNQLTGTIPSLPASLYSTDLGYNALTDEADSTPTTEDSDWRDTQTVPPTNITATALSSDTVRIAWTPIAYTGDGGYYQVKYATNPGGSYTNASSTTTDKSATSYDVTELTPGKTYYFVVETFTPQHGDQQNDLTSAFSTEVTATTLSGDVCVVQTEISPEECDALVAIYDSTDGANWTDNTDWKITNTPCSWIGITCDSGHVTKIERINKGLNGSLPDLSSLISLQELNLSGNQLIDNIPDLSILTSLQFIDLSDNRFSGNIPSLSTLTNLQALYLGENQLSGNIPNLDNLTNLQYLYLNDNQINGSIPNLNSLGNLRQLDLGNNQLSGNIPDLSALTVLETLQLDHNQLSGEIPTSLAKLTGLKTLDLGYNKKLTASDAEVIEFLNNKDPDWADTLAGSLQFKSADFSVIENSEKATITVTRTNGSFGAVSVQYTTDDNTARAGSNDYTATSSTLNWEDGDTEDKTFTVNIIDNTEIDGDKTINLSLSNPTNDATIGSQETAVLTIIDNEVQAGILQFAETTQNVNENAGSITIIVTRTEGSTGAISVNYATTNGTAIAGNDYTTISSGTLNWEEGDTENKTFTVNITDDSDFEGKETFSITLSEPTGGAVIGSPETIVLTIINDDLLPVAGIVQFSQATQDVNENAGLATITVTRTDGKDGAISVSYTIANGTAIAGNDYTAIEGTLNWEDGDAENKTFTVNITDDSDFEEKETFSITLSEPTGGAVIGSPETTVLTITIINDDLPPVAGIVQFSQATQNVNENAGLATITVTRTDGKDGAISVDYATANGTAIAGNDYTATSGTLDWEDGDTENKTFTVNIIDDNDFEDNETIVVNLTTGNASLGTQNSITLTIIDNDDNQLTVLSPIKNKVGAVGKLLTFTITADPDVDNITYHLLNDVPSGAKLDPNTGIFTWTPDKAGTFSFSVQATDDGTPNLKSNTVTFSITVDSIVVSNKPVITNPGNKSIPLGDTLQFTVMASDSDGDSINFTLKNPPVGASIHSINSITGKFTWTPNNVGTYEITVNATDKAGLSDTETFNITVTSLADLSITQTSSTDLVAAGNTLTYTLAVNNSGPDTATNIVITYTLPKNVTFVDSKGANCQEASGTITCHLDRLPVNTTTKININVTVSATASNTFTNTATVTASNDPKETNNRTHQETKVGYSLNMEILPTNNGLINRVPNKAIYLANETVNLTANSSACYTFSHWTGACEGKETKCTLTMEANKDITAHYQSNLVEFNLLAANGIVSITPEQEEYHCGDTLTLTATGPNFLGWTGDVVDKRNPLSLVLKNQQVNITALFKVISPIAIGPIETLHATVGQSIALTASGGNGKFIWAATYGTIQPSGATATYTVPEEGVFYVWVTDGNEFAWSLIDATETLVLVHIAPEELNLSINETQSIAVRGYRANSTWLDLTTKAILRSENPDIAQINEAGEVTAKSEGKTKLIASYAGMPETEIPVIVQEQIQLLKVEPNIFVLYEGATLPVMVYAITQSGNKIPHQDAKLVVQDTEIATVVGNNIQGLKQGSTWLEVSAEAFELSIPVVVRSQPKLDITPSITKIETNKKTYFSVTGGQPPYTMQDSQGENIPNIGDNTFVYQSDTADTVTLTATDHSNNQANAVVEVVPPLVVTPAKAIVKRNSQVTLKTRGGDDNYEWIVTQGYLDNWTGDSVQYTAPKRAGLHTATVIDGMGNSQEILILVGENLSLSQQQLFLVPKENVNVQILGGVPPYFLTATAGMIAKNQQAIIDYTAPKVAGTYTINVQDTVNNKASIAVTVGLNLLITPVSGRVDREETLTFHTAGGFGEIRWISSIDTSDNHKGKFFAWTAPKNFGTALIHAIDAAGTIATATVEVSSAGIAITPSVRHIYPNETADFTVTGGTTDYTWIMEAGEYKSDESVGDEIITYTAPKRKGHYKVTVRDNAGNEAQAQANVYSTKLLASPKTLYIHRGETSKIAVSGGTGEYNLWASVGRLDKGKLKLPEGDVYSTTQYQAPMSLEGHDIFYVQDTAGNLVTIDVEIAKQNDVINAYVGPDGRIDAAEMAQAISDFFLAVKKPVMYNNACFT